MQGTTPAMSAGPLPPPPPVPPVPPVPRSSPPLLLWEEPQPATSAANARARSLCVMRDVYGGFVRGFPRCAIERGQMAYDVKVINELVQKESAFTEKLLGEVQKVIVGQRYMVERILIGLLTGGHVLLEGVPGLAKTLTVKTVADALRAKFQRIQFTPDLLPADIVGTTIYNPATQEFRSKRGPIFANLVLADEINRAPAKVQSALLEAMQEKQVTIGDNTFKLEEPFLVLATQNPIEQEGTYPLPEAQVDRFMLKLKIGYPSREEERAILDLMARTTAV